MIETEYVLAFMVLPSLFYVGMAAMGVPIVIHLLARRRFRRIRWAAMTFLLEAEKQNRRRMRLRELLLLGLRCLVMVLTGLLIARPFFSKVIWGSQGFGGSRVSVWVVLDDSLSMADASMGRSTFELAKGWLGRSIESFGSQVPPPALTVIRCSRPESLWLDHVSLDPSDIPKIRFQIGSLKPSQQSADFTRIFTSVRDRLLAEDVASTAAVYVISDFQESDWTPPIVADQPSGSALTPLTAFADWPVGRTPPTLTLVSATEVHRSNLAITDLQPEESVLTAATENRFRATVANFGDAVSLPMELAVEVNDIARPSIPIPPIPVGQSTSMMFDVIFPQENGQQLSAAIRGVDAARNFLSLDDRRIFAANVRPAISALVVDGEPDTYRLRDEVTLLRTALKPEGRITSGISPVIIEDDALQTTDLFSHDVIILANVRQVSDETVYRLEKFVTCGGGLAIFFGDQVDAGVYNYLLWNDGAGLLPARPDFSVTIPDGQPALTLSVDQPNHPVVAVFSGQNNPFISQVGFRSFTACSVASLDNPAKASGNRLATVLAHFSDAEAHPAIVERSFGKGRVILFASSADLEWNDWAKSPSYVVAMVQTARHLARSADTCHVLVGEPLVVTTDPRWDSSNVTIRTPDYPVEPEQSVSGSKSATHDALAWSQTDNVGLYQMNFTRSDGSREARVFGVNPDPRESNLRSCNETELRRRAGGVRFEFIHNLDAVVSGHEEGRNEIWPLILVLLVVVLLAELALAGRFGRG